MPTQPSAQPSAVIFTTNEVIKPKILLQPKFLLGTTGAQVKPIFESQRLRSQMQSFGTLGQHFKISPVVRPKITGGGNGGSLIFVCE